MKAEPLWDRTSLAALGACLVLIAVAFAPSLGFGFVSWDDPVHITQNPMVVGGEPVGLWDRLTTPELGYPTPVTILTHNIEHALFGLDPMPYHATNVLLHLLCCALVFALGRRLGLGALGASAAVVVFGLHPAVAEPVSWASGRKDLLALCFGLGAVLWFIKAPFDRKTPKTWVALGLFTLAALSKPVVLALVPVLFVWHAMFRGEGQGKAAKSVVPFAVVAAVIFPLALFGQRANESLRDDAGLLSVLREAWYALGFHTGLLATIHANSAKYIPEQWPPGFEVGVDMMPLALLVVAAALLAVTPSDKRKIAGFGLLWALLTYLPSSSLIPLTRYLADVYLYAPLVGLGLAIGASVDRFGGADVPRTTRWVAVSAVIAVALGLFARVVPASGHWQDSASLWSNAYALHPHDPRLCRNAANGLNERKQPVEALELYAVCADKFGPEMFEKNIAVTLYVLGDRDAARTLFESMERTRPGDPTVRRYLEKLGVPVKDRGRPPEGSR